MARIVMRRRPGKTGPKNQVWANVLLNGVAVDDSPVIGSNIVQSSDWALGNAAERATLLRIRGALVVRKGVSLAATEMMACIVVMDEDIASGAVEPWLIGTYADEDVLWTATIATPATGASDGWSGHIPVDVKAMRRITSGQDVRILLQTNATVNVVVSGLLRGLVRKGGN